MELMEFGIALYFYRCSDLIQQISWCVKEQVFAIESHFLVIAFLQSVPNTKDCPVFLSHRMRRILESVLKVPIAEKADVSSKELPWVIMVLHGISWYSI